MTTTLPTPDETFKSSSGVRLLIQGVMLHLATIAGPVDVFRKQGQKSKAVKLFLNEYGLNLTLFILLQGVIVQYIPATGFAYAEVCSVLFLLFLSVVQMTVDAGRKPINVYHSARYEAGISVRVAGEKCWAFFNHYALPVGRKHGVHLRAELHTQAERNKFLLFCYAQNNDVARYYLKEHPNGELILGKSKRPLIIWDYREDVDKEYSPFNDHKRWDVFGLNSSRSSGSLPI